jgi:cytochrome P450
MTGWRIGYWPYSLARSNGAGFMLEAVKPAPGPKPLPIIGNILDLGGPDQLGTWRKLHATYGDTVRVKIGPMEAHSFANPEAIWDALVTEHKSMTKGLGYAGLRKLLGEGMIGTDQPHWASQRQRLNPLFSPAATEDYAGIIYDAVKIGVDELAEKAKRGETIDLGPAMLRLTMRVISLAAFGVDIGRDHDDIATAFDFAFGYIADSMSKLRAPMFVPTPGNVRYKRELALIESFVGRLIDNALAHPDATSMNGKIMAALEGNTRTMLRDEVISLYFAGFETTARAMTFAMDLLGRNRHLVPRLRAEARDFGRPDGGTAVLKQLPLACDVVNETLRLYPPVAMLARQPAAETMIGGYRVKAGSLVILVPFLGQRDPRYWPTGDRFAPDADNPLQKRVTHRGAFVPFGAGPRICLGKHFAMVEMAIATALLSRTFDWDVADDGEPELMFNGTIRPSTPRLATLRMAE